MMCFSSRINLRNYPILNMQFIRRLIYLYRSNYRCCQELRAVTWTLIVTYASAITQVIDLTYYP